VCFAPFPFGQEAMGLMTTAFSVANKNLSQDRLAEQMNSHGWSWKHVGAICGLGLGIICPLFGTILTAIVWLTGPEWHGLHLQRAGSVLLFLTIPFLIFGAHCLDLVDRQD
jgi:hypothetical protein